MTSTDADPTAPVFERRLASDPAQVATVRHAIETFCTDRGLDADCVAGIGLCVNEALANIIRHAYRDRHDRPILLRLICNPDHVHLTIRDWGDGVVPELKLPAEHNPLVPGGLGLVCLQKLMDEVLFFPQSDGMLLSMKKRLPARASSCAPQAAAPLSSQT